jgi:hypothetical protein
LEIIYKSNKEPKQRELEFGLTGCLNWKRSVRAFNLTKDRVSKEKKAQAINIRGESRECVLEANIDN